MARDVQKYIDEYNKKYIDTNQDQFHASDFVQLHDLAKGDLFNLISNALTYGFMVGRESVQQNNPEIVNYSHLIDKE